MQEYCWPIDGNVNKEETPRDFTKTVKLEPQGQNKVGCPLLVNDLCRGMYPCKPISNSGALPIEVVSLPEIIN